MNKYQISNEQTENEANLLIFTSKIKIKEKERLLRTKEEFNNLVRRQYFGRLYNPEFMNKQQRIKTLFGILQKTCKILELNLSTFFLTVHIFDATISKIPVSNEDMLRVGLVAMVLAAKINESNDKVITLSLIHI